MKHTSELLKEKLRGSKGVGSLLDFVLLPRSPSGSQGRFKSKSFGNSNLPCLAAKRPTPLYASPKCLKLLRRLHLIDVAHPVSGPSHRPRAKQCFRLRLPLVSPPQTRPAPILRTLNQLCPQRVALDIARHRQNILLPAPLESEATDKISCSP